MTREERKKTDTNAQRIGRAQARARERTRLAGAVEWCLRTEREILAKFITDVRPDVRERALARASGLAMARVYLEVELAQLDTTEAG